MYRRLVLKTLILSPLLPRLTLACSGDGPYFPSLFVIEKLPQRLDEPLDEYITRYLGHSDWSLDKRNNIIISVPVINKGRMLEQRIMPVRVSWLLDNVEFSGECIGMDIVLERTIKWYPEPDKNIKAFTFRSKIGSFNFPEKGAVTEVAIKVDTADIPGRVICIGKFRDSSNPDKIHYRVNAATTFNGSICSASPDLVPSFEIAWHRCETESFRGRDGSSKKYIRICDRLIGFWSAEMQ